MTRPSTYGPRSLTVHSTDRPLAVFVTLTDVPLGSVRWAQPPATAAVNHDAFPAWPLAYLVVVVVGAGLVVVVAGLARVVVVVGRAWVVVVAGAATVVGGGGRVVAGVAGGRATTALSTVSPTPAAVERAAPRPARAVPERSSAAALSRVAPEVP